MAFLTEPVPPRGALLPVLPGVHRIVADNPSLMTYSETDPTSLKFVGKLDRSRDTFRLVRAKLDLPQTRIDFFAFDLAGQDQAAATKFGMSQPEWKRAAAPR